VTDIRVALQGRHATWPPGRWQDISTIRASTSNSFAEHIFPASAGGVVETLISFGLHMFLDGGLRLVAVATGGATQAGDSVVGEIKAW
jgi:hypothetical protein